jgi:hypothetical protein
MPKDFSPYRHGRLSAEKTLGEPAYEPLADGSVSPAESPRNVFAANPCHVCIN